MGSGNRICGSRKRRAAGLGIGQVHYKRGSRVQRISTVNECFEEHRDKLLAYLSTAAVERTVIEYINGIVQATLHNRSEYVQRVTLVEGPSEYDSLLAKANAELGGASLRIVKPDGEHSSVSQLPALQLGIAVSWPLDLLTIDGRKKLERYLHHIVPVAGTEMVHFHASCICTGTSRININVNKKVSKEKRRYHIACRKALTGTRKIFVSYRKGGFQKTYGTRSSSSEQPWNAMLPTRGKGVSQWPRIMFKRQMIQTVTGCICGMRLRERTCKRYILSCKGWKFQTDNPSLAGMLRQLHCSHDHPAANTLAAYGTDAVYLKDTGVYREGLAKLMVLSLMLKWRVSRTWVV